MNNIPHPIDDEYCLARISEGNEHCFNLIFKKYRDQLYGYLVTVTKSREVSEEIVLDIFLKIWNGREGAAEIRDLEAYLFRIAHRRAIDFFRATKRNPELQDAIWEAMASVPGVDDADTLIHRKNIEQLIKEAVNQLSPQRKKVFELRNLEDMSYAEIGKNMQLSSNTVRNHLAAAVQSIRAYLIKNKALVLLPSWFFEKML